MNLDFTIPAIALGLTVFGQAAMAQDVDAGEKVFRKCAACHKVGEDAKNGVGPHLNNLFGRAAGSAEGYKYSKTLSAANAAGLIWDEDLVFEYIADPKAFMRAYLDDSKAKPKMVFKLADEQDRRDVLAYLAQFSDPAETEETEEQAATPPATPVDTAGKICVQNASDHSHFFVAEDKADARVTATLAPGQTLCTTVTNATTGIVSVFETVEAFEGCSRLVKPGSVEELKAFAEFDRCLWSSNAPAAG